jgi:hypothetical protein
MKKMEYRIMRLEDSLRELAKSGSPVDMAVVAEESAGERLEIEQFGNPEDNRIFELEDGRTGYMLTVCVTNQTSKSMYIDDVELRLPWEERLFEWLLPHTANFKDRKKNKTSSYEQYKFPGKNGLELPAEDVINHVLTQGTRLLARRPARGWLLATGGPMPNDLLQGAQINSTLVITTSDHVKHGNQILLWIERLQTRPTRPERTSSLFERPVVAEHVTENQHSIPFPENPVSNDREKGARVAPNS